MKRFKNTKLPLICVLLLLAIATPTQAFDLDIGSGLGDVLKNLPIGKDKSTKQENNADGALGLVQAVNFKEFSQEEEIKIGTEISGNLLGAAPLVKNPALQQYVNQVGRWVASQSERKDLTWYFGVIESEDINAFSAPGGYVLITKGLYRKLGSEAQLAGVLAHEIGHIIKKHHLKVMQKSQLIGSASKLVGNQAAQGNGFIKNLIGSGAEICARGLDKDAEFEADRIGIVLTSRAGYDAYGLVDVLQEIGHVPSNDSSVALLFKTHPAPDERLAKLGDAVGDRLDTISDGKTLETRFYRLK